MEWAGEGVYPHFGISLLFDINYIVVRPPYYSIITLLWYVCT